MNAEYVFDATRSMHNPNSNMHTIYLPRRYTEEGMFLLMLFTMRFNAGVDPIIATIMIRIVSRFK